MRGTLAVFAVAATLSIGLGAGIVGCNSKSNPVKPPPSTDQPQESTNWALTFQSKCPNMESMNDCVAGYGFTILSDGHFQLGPDPQQQIRNGTLSQEEFKAIDTLLATALTGSQSAPQGKLEVEEPFENEDSLAYMKGSSQPQILAKAAGNEFNYQTRSPEDAKALYAMARKLAMQYYSAPFPDPCIEGVMNLQGLLASMQSCTIDTDCVYMENFEAVDSGIESVTTDDCSIIKPLAVGNAASVRGSKEKLTESLSVIQNSCGDKLIREDCTENKTFAVSGKKPVCKANTCQLTQ